MRDKTKNHPDVQAAIDSMPHVLEPWGMLHLIAAFNTLADERDAVRDELRLLGEKGTVP